MVRKSLFFSILAGFSAAIPPAAAQSYFHSMEHHARIEQADPIVMQIGAEGGRAYFRALNAGPAAAVARVFIERVADEKTGEIQRFIHMAPVAAYAAAETIYLDQLANGKSWITGWEVASVEAPQHEIADRDEAPFYRMPPRYPGECMVAAKETEKVLVNFDVTAEGRLENIIIRDVTDGCFALATQRLVSQWRYAPKIENGAPAPKRHLETLITYVLED